MMWILALGTLSTLVSLQWTWGCGCFGAVDILLPG